MFSVAFNSLGAILLILMVYLPLRRRSRVSDSLVALGGAALALFFGNLDQIDSMKVSSSGFEAKTREMQGVIDDAKATVASLHALAAMTAALQVDLLAAEGRWTAETTILHKDEQKARLLTRLKALGLTDEELAEVDRADRAWVIRDYVIAVLKPLNDAIDPTKVAAYTTAFYAADPPTPDECAALLQQFHVDDEKIKGLLEDYRYYFETNKQRRPEVWRNRWSW